MAIKKLLKTTTFRLSAIYLSIVILTALAIGGYMQWKTNQLLGNELMNVISAEVKGLAEQYRQGGFQRLARTINTRSLRPGGNLYYFGAPEGIKIAGNLTFVPEVFKHTNTGQKFEYIWRRGNEQEQRSAVGVPFKVAGGPILIVARDIEDQRNFIKASKQIFFIGLGVISIVCLGTGLWVSRNLLRRIESVSETSKAIMAGDMSERIALNGSDDEIDRLSLNLNAMLDRIETLLTGLRQVSDNIAHDLKTPLNRLRNRAESALIDPRGSPAHHEALQHTIEEADGLINTFNALLKIARLEAGAEGENADEMDLKIIGEEVVELYEPVAEEAGFKIRIGRMKEALIQADRQLLAQAVANLMDNAIKYGKPVQEMKEDEERGAAPSEITLEVWQDEGHGFLSVTDNGPGIPEAQNRRVFDRFVRLEESRTKPGSGLGLAMVAAVIAAYKGKIELKDNQPGLRVIVQFPLV